MYSSDERHSPLRWTELTSTDDCIAYERRTDTGARRSLLRLRACRTPRSLPVGSGTPGWRLQLEQLLRTTSSTRHLGNVASRSAAVSASFEAMQTVNRIVDANDELDGSLVETLRERLARPRQ